MEPVPTGIAATTQRVAKLLSAGVTPEQLRGEAWLHPLHGVARHRGSDSAEPRTRIGDALALLGPGDALGGWASLHTQAVTSFDGRGRALAERPVLLHTATGHQLRHRSGIEPTRLRLRSGQVIDFDGHGMTSLPRAVYDEMRMASGLTEAVAVLDAATSRLTREVRTEARHVDWLVFGERKTRGTRQAREALRHGSERSMSRGESRLRVTTELVVGVTPLLVNAPVFDPAGRLAGVVDLLHEEAGLVLEYDGVGHREAVVHAQDNAREEELEDLGLVVVRVSGIDLRSGPELDRRIRRGLQRGVSRDRTRDRWTTVPPLWWHGSAAARRWGHPPWR